jgi:MSHA biogenesis protein MshL
VAVSREIDAEVGAFTINRQAGIVSVFGNQRQHRLIGDYLSALRGSVTRQVLIEAKIMDVVLSDAFDSGINWRALFDNMYSIGAPLGAMVAPGPFTGPLDATPGVVTLAVDNSDLDVIFNFVQRFGTVRTLSSPRVAVLQNQTAILKVAENQVFFQLFFERIERDDGDDVINISSEIRTVPVGVVITVQPSINETNRAISLALRPSVTRVTEVVNDPAVAIASNNTVESQVPVIGVQEIDSVVTMRSGQVVVMGGLMRDVADSADEGVPVLGQLPWLGYLFKGHRDQYRKSELVIFLRATILEDGGIDPVDAELYRRLSGDRRPFPMPAFAP